MPSTVETILATFQSLLAGNAAGAKVLRDVPVPTAIPTAGLVIMRSNFPGAADMTMPRTYHYDHPVDVEIYAQKATGRTSVTDVIRTALGDAITADSTLSGLCDFIDAEFVEGADIPIEGAAPIRSEMIRATLSYSTTNPIS